MAANKIVYGNRTFEGVDIKSGNCYLEISLLSDALSINTLEFVVASDDTMLVTFTRNDPLTYFHGGRQVGIFYVQTIDRIGVKEYSFSATSAMGLLDEGLHYGGVYAPITFGALVDDICGDVPHFVKTNVREIPVYGWLPIGSPRSNLSQALFAVGASVKTDLNGIIRIEGLWDGVSAEFPKNKMRLGGSVEYESDVTSVVVMEHQYIKASISANTYFEGTTNEGDTITFREPVYDIESSGLTILESGANFVRVGSGSGVITAKPYIHTTKEVIRDVNNSPIKNVRKVEEATLVSIINSSSVADRLVNYYKSNQTIVNDATYNLQAPGAVAEIFHPYDTELVSGCVQSVDINMSTTLKANVNALVDFLPIQTEQIVIYDRFEILTGAGTWTPPEGVTEVRAVLIGGGGAGRNGADGTGRTTSLVGSYSSDNKEIRAAAGSSASGSAHASTQSSSIAAGNGGSGGTAGVQGRVREITLNVDPENGIAYACGGASIATAPGNPTTFGSETSDEGGLLPSGYTDITTGITYALPGASGLTGGNGGASGLNGASVDGVPGGAASAPSSSNYNRNNITHSPGYGASVTSSVSATASFLAGGGGGAGGGSRDTKGTAGTAATIYSSSNIVVGSSSYSQIGAYSYGTQGGRGGNGASGASGATYGSAGDGGGGGGGGGFAATASVSTNITTTLTGGTSGLVLTIYATASTSSFSYPSAYGYGGAGGNGVEGCILLYYGEKRTMGFGPIMTSDNDFFTDSLGRKVIT